MNDWKIIWNNFCDDVADSVCRNNPEKLFEEGVAREFFNALNWNRLNKGLTEQYPIRFATVTHRADFALFVPGNDSPEIIVELKRPKKKKEEKDAKQLIDYMKQTSCSYGVLLLGDNLEIYFIDYSKPQHKASLVETIKYLHDNEAARQFMDVLQRNSYNRDCMQEFCNKRVEINKCIEKWCSAEGKNEILDVIVERSQLPQHLRDTLRSMLVVDVKRRDELNPVAAPVAQVEEQDVDSKEEQPQVTSKPKRQYDKTQYSINGGAFEGKRRFVYRLVKTYVEQHPAATFADLERVFDPTLQGGYGVIRTLDFIREKGYEEYRYFMKPDELLRGADGKVFAVCSQWGIGNTPRVVEFARQLGYKITTTGEAPKTIIKSSGLISCVLTRNANAKGIFDTATQTLTVLKGSTINPGCVDKIRPVTKATRDAQVAKFAERRGNELVVVRDAVFDSPSGAAVFCVGGSANGWIEWKDENNNKLEVYRK